MLTLISVPRAAAGGLLSIAVASVSVAEAQTSEKPLTVAECVKLIRPDSVHMFFDAQYALTPPTCAAIRRESRMDATSGTFLGEVRDYALPDNSLLTKVQYAAGQRMGPYEQHYRNQQLAVSGQFAQGQPVGTWKYWYANGRPWQTLELTAEGPLRIVAYWDSTGQQRVSAGAGTWQESTGGTLPTRTGGRVAAGLMEGTWERRSLLDKQVLTAEDYRGGRLQEGRQYIGVVGKPKKYQTQSLLGPRVADVSASIEPFHLGKSCEERAQLAAAAAASRAAYAAMIMVQPTPPRDPSTYQREILMRLSRFNNLTQWMPRTDGQSTVVTAEVDAQGQLHNFTSESGGLSNAFASIMRELGAWHPATVNGRPVPGQVRIILKMYSSQLQSSLQANVAFPLPPDVMPKTTK
ncbi:toxin-antitoxin system YwqK family antitoxin [Hymenobacter ruricola]|uniref:TonB C-terminal domain-containing protein n=1 Tax=Hymenobacter ruricola TaxID=2791023 RepID=A0ABS0I3T9_9BACT|nr:hypothetical protein [Hymenobacter ruricola]MBF9221607.1 hypothetical protein [Hymenobacter ruricola]